MKNNVYIQLAEKLEAPTSKRFINILEAMFTPEETEICLNLFTPATCPELAKRLQVDEKSLFTKLENLADRGVLTQGKTQYAFHTHLIGFHHDVVADCRVNTGPHAVSNKVLDLWDDFFWNEWRHMLLKGRIQGGARGAVWPAIGALEFSPNIRPEQILPEENWKLKIQNAKRRIIGPCGCRVVWGRCNHPMEVCFSAFDKPRGIYYLNKPGRMLKEYSLEETLALVRRAEEAGLVHQGECYCCSCSCMVLNPLNEANRLDLTLPNRFRAVVNEEQCIGCQTCVERCPFNAIEMKKSGAYKKLKASINSENCKGCGVCIVGCKQRALRYEIVRPPEYIVNIQQGPLKRNPPFSYYELE